MRPMLGEIQGLQCLNTKPFIPEDPGLPRTLICNIVSPWGTLSARVIIDPGSQISAIQKSLASKMNLKGPLEADKKNQNL